MQLEHTVALRRKSVNRVAFSPNKSTKKQSINHQLTHLTQIKSSLIMEYSFLQLFKYWSKHDPICVLCSGVNRHASRDARHINSSCKT